MSSRYKKDLREYIKQQPFNGEYATVICASCKGYLVSPQGDTDTCPIVKKCENCKSKNGHVLGNWRVSG